MRAVIRPAASLSNDVTRPAGLLSPVRVRGDYVYTFALP